MTDQLKAKVLVGIIAVMGVWPFVHFWLTQTQDINPWRLWGVAMYLQRHEVQVRMFERVRGAERPIQPGALPEAVRQAGQDFHERRQVVGKLTSPDELGARLLSARTQADAVIVRVGVRRIAPEKRALAVDWESYEYAARR